LLQTLADFLASVNKFSIHSRDGLHAYDVGERSLSLRIKPTSQKYTWRT
jgi:hypothetical protein